ncbi:hypothetical protein [Bradyrhizobium sp. CCGUVB23]|uniref:hypothetical protein n=1 Tax=Bradyrhizobium sp. CCGUVB23 TaxID=2949630 RepID=UPI0020B36137|nr:hypothetical protein [Bradyrhizobium sp. CCGUVB23]MCP3468024.1 hypothetical protein [Bradyrhizobium sp. CCGUVB23]
MSTPEQMDEHATREATYRAIGMFIHQFASVEWALRYHLAQAVKLSPVHMDIIITHDFALLCTAVAVTFSDKLKTDADKKQLKKLISQCRAMNDTRVKVVHGQWFPFMEGGAVTHRSRQNLKSESTIEMASAAGEAGAGRRRLVYQPLRPIGKVRGG